ncbi:MerR family DNA-binding transcriptional regulator, partial [Campylobacter jejuni]|nr:MerR family DNA-binding transcriptional regulator [Campylobacter jejuni]
MIDKLVSIRHAANLLGITIQTIRNWDKQGFLKPDILVKGADYKDKLVVGADIVS